MQIPAAIAQERGVRNLLHEPMREGTPGSVDIDQALALELHEGSVGVAA